jgi:hypothetical protein
MPLNATVCRCIWRGIIASRRTGTGRRAGKERRDVQLALTRLRRLAFCGRGGDEAERGLLTWSCNCPMDSAENAGRLLLTGRLRG